MTNEQYSLSWQSYQKNICKGLGSLQERGEFVDMTLAADGHFVKVHKMVMSLISPYIKDLITSADCSHPVIFLNNITYTTLSSILEYIYTGEVCVTRDNLSEVLQAGKALHIKGLVDMIESSESGHVETDLATLKVNESTSLRMHDYRTETISDDMDTAKGEPLSPVANESSSKTTQVLTSRPTVQNIMSKKSKDQSVVDSQIQYSMSNQGNLQMVLNRYVYNVRYLYKNSNRRMWRCIFYPKQLRCPAYVITENDKIIERCCTHNHAFHDKNIIRKVRDGRVFTVLKDAQLEIEIQKRTKDSTVEEQTNSVDSQ
ncbi:protein tramtrack, beta isoform [Manduca sexta]|uniref:BTB domain-containing protein n=1 Tax=Manduca sexta TaxID=7130 RepID=A0A922CRG6_MANSE|nr:protein tramtrack, beta isoform [Manduca sexta]KAG6455511.1 hypothetical protein O3G_MSEX009248 [Manduca sexta]